MPSIAARVAGWQRRLGGQAGPLGAVSAGSGDSPNGQPLQVELLISGLWVDITSYVMTRDGSGDISISRGQPNEAANTDPSRCLFQLNNRGGQFSPRNPLSPYYGQIGRNTPIRVSVPSGNDKSYRFLGEVVQWPQHWDTTGTDVWVELEAAGILRRLGQGAAPIGSAMYTAMIANLAYDPAVAGSGLDPVVGYWPMEDDTHATQIASALSGHAPLSITGTPSLAQQTDFICSNALPVMNNARFDGLVPPYTPQSGLAVRFLMTVPSGGIADGQIILSFTTTGTVVYWNIYYNSTGSGQIGVRGYTSDGTVIFDSGSSGPVNGIQFEVSLLLEQTDTDVFWNLGALGIGTWSGPGSAGTVSAAALGRATYLAVGNWQQLAGTAIGHLRFQTYDASVGSLWSLSLLQAFAGETADRRFSRLMLMSGIPRERIGFAFDTATMGAQLSGTLVDLVTECSAADVGIVYELLSDLGLGYRTRASLYNQTAALTLAYDAFQLSHVPTPLDDDQYTRNDITVTRKGGSSARLVQGDGPMSVLPPPNGVGRYDESVTVNVATDSVLVDQAGWRLHIGTVDEPRYPVISVNLAHPSITPALRAQVLAVRQGDRITVTGMPSWVPGDLSQIVRGITESITGFEHRISFACSPESPWRVSVLADSTLCQLDSDGSQMAVEAPASAVSLSVAIAAGTWTTTDLPFDAMIAGERVTVTAISGASSPQTWTVTRAVNGVSKVLPVGAAVHLYQPSVLAL